MKIQTPLASNVAKNKRKICSPDFYVFDVQVL